MEYKLNFVGYYMEHKKGLENFIIKKMKFCWLQVGEGLQNLTLVKTYR